MSIIGYLRDVPGTDFRCPGGSCERVCRSSSGGNPAVYEVRIVSEARGAVLSVTASASDAPEEEAAEVLGRVAELSLKEAAPMDAESWVRRSISSGGQYFAEGTEARLYGTERSRTFEIVAAAPPAARVPEIPVVQGFEATQKTTPAPR